MIRLVALTCTLALFGCPSPTRFEGEAKFPDGVAGCRRACAREGLEMAGFVFSGEFSTSCVCQAPKQDGGPAASEVAPSAGVMVQMQAAVAAAAAQQRAIQQQQQRQQQRY
jgi:hypothetical protein